MRFKYSYDAYFKHIYDVSSFNIISNVNTLSNLRINTGFHILPNNFKTFWLSGEKVYNAIVKCMASRSGLCINQSFQIFSRRFVANSLFYMIISSCFFFAVYNSGQKLSRQTRKTESYLTPQVMNNQFK